MPDQFTAWTAIALVAAITIGSRLSGPLIMARFRLSPLVERFLQNLSLSVIAALVASMLARGGAREGAAVVTAALVMLTLRKSIWAMGAGMVVAAIWTFVAP